MKKLMMAVAVMFSLGLAGCAKPTTTQTPQTVTEAGTVTLHKYVKVSLSKAWAIFKDAFPKSAVTGITLEQKGDHYRYAVSGVDDSQAHALDINAKTGDVSGKTSSDLAKADADGTKKAAAGLAKSGLETLTAVTNLAEKQLGNGDAYKWTLTQDDGSVVWNVSVKSKKKVTLVTIDAYGGEILKTKTE